MEADATMSDALDELSNVLTAISESPYSLELHAKHITLTSLPELSEQFESAIELLTTFFAAPPQVWQAYLHSKVTKLGIPEDFEDADEVTSVDLKNVDLQTLNDLFECFRRATSDYLCPYFSIRFFLIFCLILQFSYSNPQKAN